MIGMGRTEAKSGLVAKRPMATTSGASLPRDVSVFRSLSLVVRIPAPEIENRVANAVGARANAIDGCHINRGDRRRNPTKGIGSHRKRVRFALDQCGRRRRCLDRTIAIAKSDARQRSGSLRRSRVGF